MSRPRVGVVGHVEWLELAVVGRVPRTGEIVRASDVIVDVGGGGGVAAVQLALLGACVQLWTAVGSDALGARAVERLRAHGVCVHGAVRPGPQLRAFAHLADDGERTITILGPPVAPSGGDALPWERLASLDAVYVTAGDAAAIRAARAAGIVVATARAAPGLADAGVRPDVLVLSAADADEQALAALLGPAAPTTTHAALPGSAAPTAADAAPPGSVAPTGVAARAAAPPTIVLRTDGARGGTWVAADGRSGAWDAAPPPGPPVDAFGCGDGFAAALTLALGAGRPLDDAIAYAARAGAAVLTGRGPYAPALQALGLP